MLVEEVNERTAGLEALTGHTFRRRQLAYDALVNPGYENEHQHEGYRRSYQKGALANIGDAALDLLVTEHLLEGHPPAVAVADIGAEQLTVGRIALVNGERLTALSHHIGLERLLLLNRGERNKVAEERERCSILGESFEAIVGALFLDGGLEPCRDFLGRIEFYAFKKEGSDW